MPNGYISNKYDLNDAIEKEIQKVVLNVDDIEESLNNINSALKQMRELAVKAVDDDNEENDIVQMQNEINQLSYELNQRGNISTFSATNLLGSNTRTACLCSITPGVDMSSTVLNGKDSRLTGDLTELIDNYIYVQNGMNEYTDVTITLDTNGRVILSGYIYEYSTNNRVYPKAYYMASTVNSQNGNVTFSGYGLSFSIPYQEYIEFLANGVAEKPKKVNIKIDYYNRVYSYGQIPTDGYVNYYGSGTKLTDFTIQNADNLTSFYMSGTTGSNTTGATALHIMYTLADGTKVDDNIYNYNGNIKYYIGAGGLRINYNYYSHYNPYSSIPYFIIDLPSIYRLKKAGGLETYKKTSKIVDIPNSYSSYSTTKSALYSVQPSPTVLDISTSNAAAESIITIDNAIEKINKKLKEISDLKN